MSNTTTTAKQFTGEVTNDFGGTNEVALIEALNDAWITEDDLTVGELNSLHAIFEELRTEVGDTDAARMALEEVLEGS
jgi:hypothetical protein